MSRPIFVIGSMRSGSTLFRLILDAHPSIAIPEETGFMGALAPTRQIPNWQHGTGWYRRLGWSDEEFDGRLRDFYAGMFERYALEQGKQRWGEKTPFHSRHIAQMASIFPDAVFAAIVRHPGAVVNSLVRKFHYEVGDAVDYWDSTNREILQRGAELGAERFALLRYEDLVTEPEGTLRELVGWLQEPWSDALLRHNDVQAAQGAPRVSAGNTRTRDPINTDLADRWADALDAPSRRVLADRAGELSVFLGYDPLRPGTTGPLVPPSGSGRAARALLTGDLLADRLRASPGISLDQRAASVIMPEMSPAELAKRLQVAEAALARLRSSRAVRWTLALRRSQRRAAALPAELRSAGSALTGRAGRKH